MKLLAIISFIFSALIAHSQNMSAVERSLLANYRRINYWKSYAGDDEKVDKFDSLEKANIIFQKALVNMASNYPGSLTYDFKLLRDSGLTIETSNDHHFRIYSWDSEEGGTMHIFLNVYQWIGEQHVYAKASDSSGGKDGIAGVFCTPIYTFYTPGRTYYLVINHAIFSTKDESQDIQAFCINKRSLNDSVRIFKTQTGLQNAIGFEFDFFSVVDRPERPIQLIDFDITNKIVKIPIVFENGTVTNRWIRYKWTGKYFERIRK
jgi:hypothetical protein